MFTGQLKAATQHGSETRLPAGKTLLFIQIVVGRLVREHMRPQSDIRSAFNSLLKNDVPSTAKKILQLVGVFVR